MCFSLQDTLDATSEACKSEIPNKWLFDIILAADTFVYVGALGKVFQTVRECLNTGGLFAFSVEVLQDEVTSDPVPEFSRSHPELDPPGSLGGW